MALLTASAFCRWPTIAPDARRHEAQAPAILPLVALQLARVLASPGPGMRGRPRCAQAPADLPFVALQLARVLASPGPRQLCSTASVSLPSGACRAEP